MDCKAPILAAMPALAPAPRPRWCTAAVVLASALVLQACSAVRLAYQQVPQLAAWQIHRHLDLTDTQQDQVREALNELHQWHRDTMLPRHARLLQQVQQQLPGDVTAEQACATYADVRTQLERVIAQAEPRLVWLASQLTAGQIRHLQKKQADSNADWKKEWLDPTPGQRRELRYERLLSRAESFYGPLEPPQKALLREFIARQSTWDPQHTYAERLRRQQDLVQVLQQIAQDRANIAQARTLLRGYLNRLNTSPDATYESAARQWVEEGCAAFAQLHNAMTDAQRLKAVQSVKGYERDFWVLAGR